MHVNNCFESQAQTHHCPLPPCNQYRRTPPLSISAPAAPVAYALLRKVAVKTSFGPTVVAEQNTPVVVSEQYFPDGPRSANLRILANFESSQIERNSSHVVLVPKAPGLSASNCIQAATSAEACNPLSAPHASGDVEWATGVWIRAFTTEPGGWNGVANENFL